MLIQEFYFKSLICMIFLLSYHLASLSFPLSCTFSLDRYREIPKLCKTFTKNILLPILSRAPQFFSNIPKFFKDPTNPGHTHLFQLFPSPCLWVAQSCSIVRIYISTATCCRGNNAAVGNHTTGHQQQPQTSCCFFSNKHSEEEQNFSIQVISFAVLHICQRKTVYITNFASVLLIWTLKIQFFQVV